MSGFFFPSEHIQHAKMGCAGYVQFFVFFYAQDLSPHLFQAVCDVFYSFFLISKYVMHAWKGLCDIFSYLEFI